MNLLFENAKMKGKILLCNTLHENNTALRDREFYKFIWILSGEIELEIDHQRVILKANQLMSLSHLYRLEFVRIEGEYIALLFNSNFYCIHGNDHEVSCNGLLFHGSSQIVIFDLKEKERDKLETLLGIMQVEFEDNDHLQEEMLRVLLKRFIILCTRIAENRHGVAPENGSQFEMIRKFHVLVDTYYKEKKQVQEYADMLNKSPKTLANILSSYHQPSAIRIIHDRIKAEAERLLLYSNKSAKEIAVILGFEDQATFSRFFKKTTGLSTSNYRSVYKNKAEKVLE
ncbi:AraC family transcriptional regulator [Parabacteroides provencensis]|uniref:AraC family transcriptional regulator n=1 Tax=Parabacteroides provencensis TaxID=1944636 RepID=UPI000C14EFB9